jgi:hypothetical protein
MSLSEEITLFGQKSVPEQITALSSNQLLQPFQRVMPDHFGGPFQRVIPNQSVKLFQPLSGHPEEIAEEISDLSEKSPEVPEEISRMVPDRLKKSPKDLMKSLEEISELVSESQNQEVALPSERPEEISDKSEISSIRNSQSAPGACLGKTMLGGLHQCQVDVQRFSLPQKATGASLGRTMPLRTLSLKPLTDVSEIWNEAERRLKTNRSNFSLVYEGSHYLPTSGFLPKPTQLFEIRWQGRGGKPKAINQRQLTIDWHGLHKGLIQWADTVEVAIWKWATKEGLRLSRENKIIGGYFANQKFERPTNITVREFFEGIDPENWGFYIEGPTWQDNFRISAEEVFTPPQEEEIAEEPQDPALIDTGDLPWIDPKDRGIVTTPHYDSPTFAADFTDGQDFKPKKNEQPFKLKVSINGKNPVTRDAYQRESILQWLAIQGEILDEKTSISGGKDVRTHGQLEIKFQDYFKGIPMTERTMYISNPTDLGFVRRRPRANPSLPPASGASLGQTTPPNSPTSSFMGI